MSKAMQRRINDLEDIILNLQKANKLWEEDYLALKKKNKRLERMRDRTERMLSGMYADIKVLLDPNWG